MRERRHRKTACMGVNWGRAAQSQSCARKGRDREERRRKAERKREMKLELADVDNNVRGINVKMTG